MNTTFARTILLLGGSLESSDDRGLAEDERSPSTAEDEPDLRIEEAVLALVRGCLTRNCRLAMWNDPVLTPLVIEVALEYWESLPGEERGIERRRFSGEPILVFGYNFDEEESEVLGYYAQIGCIQLARDFDPAETPIDRIVCVGDSTRATDLLAMVQVRSGRLVPVYPIASTGGIARTLDKFNEVVELEGPIADRIAGLQRQIEFDPPRGESFRDSSAGDQGFRVLEQEGETIPQFRAALYPLIVSEILDEETRTTNRQERSV